MSYVAISFPVSKGTPDSRKNESLKLARKFSKELGLVPGKDVEISLLRESTYGVVLPADVDNEVIKSAKRFGGKVAPFVESDTSARKSLKEGTWVKLPKAAAGIRFEMHGTTAKNPQEGKILPGDYFILGIEESNGGSYATLGRVDKLVEIGKEGKGRYTYNVDLDVLAQSVAQEKIKTESKKTAAKTESSEADPSHDRSNEILDLLLENDPYVIRAERKEKAKQEAKVEAENAEPSFEDMLNMSMAEAVGNTKQVVESESTEATTEVAATETTDATTEVDATTQEDDAEKASEDTSDEQAETKQEADQEDDDLDPDLYVEGKEILEALEANGLDINEMSDEELAKFISEMSADEGEEAKEEDAETSTEADESSDSEEAEEAPASDESFEVGSNG